jgi:DNA-binding NarL/FixJ family response regulator
MQTEPDSPEDSSSSPRQRVDAAGRSLRLGNVSALARVVRALPSTSPNSVEHKRAMIAEFCRLLGSSFSAPPPDPTAGLPPRHVQTLQRLLEGDSEKQIARRLGVSPHTVHVYVKALYRHFDVSSRGELLARFIRSPINFAPRGQSPE